MQILDTNNLELALNIDLTLDADISLWIRSQDDGEYAIKKLIRQDVQKNKVFDSNAKSFLYEIRYSSDSDIEQPAQYIQTSLSWQEILIAVIRLSVFAKSKGIDKPINTRLYAKWLELLSLQVNESKTVVFDDIDDNDMRYIFSVILDNIVSERFILDKLPDTDETADFARLADDCVSVFYRTHLR